MGSKYAKLREEVKELDELISKLSNYKNIDSSTEFENLYQDLMLINKCEKNVRKCEIPKNMNTKLGKYIANLYVEVNPIEIFFKYLSRMVSKIFENEDDSEIDSKTLNCFSILSNILINNADVDMEFGTDICENEDLLKLFYKILDKFQEKIVDDTTSQTYVFIVMNVVTILYNTLIHESNYNIMKMREYNFIEIMTNLFNITYLNKLYVEGTNIICINSILFTSYAVDETNVDIIAGYEKLICHIIAALEDSLKENPTHEFSTEELAKGILQLSRNDKNKLLLVNCKILPLLTKLLDEKSVEIQKTSLLILWSLTFLDSNKKIIKRKFLVKIENMRNNMGKFVYKDKDTDEFLSHFEDIIPNDTKSKNEIDELRESLDKFIWVLKGERKPISSKVGSKTSEDMIMISYCHKDRPLVQSIYNELKMKNYKLWIDFENMTEKMTDSMALAVEQSKAIIVCESRGYQNSENCRQEVIYARECKKRLVPLLVEKDFKPFGWLGISLTDLLRVNMSGKYDFETSMSKLIEYLDRQVFNKDIDECDNITPVLSVVTNNKPTNKVSGLVSWTNSDVIVWLQKIGVTKINSEIKWIGTDLEFLRDMKKETIVKYCTTNLGIVDLTDTRIIYEELQKL